MMEGDDTGVRLHSTLSHRKEPLIAGPGGQVRIYVCGPTVYGPIHIGNARPFVVFSVLRRVLQRMGLRATLVSNLTDINDKIYDAARAEGVSSPELAERYSDQYIADTDRLGLGRPDHEPRVTGTIEPIIAMIGDLIASDLAYPAGGDVYFRVERFPGYGDLSGRRLEDMVAQEPGPMKESALDFALWKGHKHDEDTSWDSPWGPGRPGWHIECSAMAECTLGHGFEIHGGGIDLVFPHHENEIAQSEGARGGRMAAIWMHNEMLELGDEKMSKSLGNTALLRDVLDRWPAEVVVAFFLTSHYRSRLPFSEDRLNEAAAAVARLTNGLRALDEAAAGTDDGTDTDLARAVVTGRERFFGALSDDFGTPGAFAALFDLVRAANRALADGSVGAAQAREVALQLRELLDTLGLGAVGSAEAAADGPPAAVVALAEARQQARAARDFAEADRLRERITAAGYAVTDAGDGFRLDPA